MQPIPLIAPALAPPLDPDFRPAVLANRRFAQDVRASRDATPLVFGLARPDGTVSRFETHVFAEGHPRAAENVTYAERLLKFLLWQRGAATVYAGGPRAIGEALRACYAPGGERAFDAHFMGDEIYQQPFELIPCAPVDVPAEHELERSLGRHLDGNRIGFDLGASDLKVSAVVEGEPVFSTEIVWEPRDQTDPAYHRGKIMDALRLAASKLPQVDAVGGSSAGVYINNRPMIASLYRGIPKERFDEVRSMFLAIRDELGVPLEIVNDGEVTALAGSMSLEVNRILGIALGSSEAAGYVTATGSITGWLNELAFAPIDYNPQGPVDEWSGDRGVGAQYFSQQCVFRLAPEVGIDIPQGVTNAEQLRFVQDKLEAGDEGAVQIWQSIGVYMGYGIAHYADFYDLEHVLLLGRVTSGRGGDLILEGARQVLEAEFPELAARLTIQLPDEKARRVGQSVAAASLPSLEG